MMISNSCKIELKLLFHFLDCDCSPIGSLNNTCNAIGTCNCKAGFNGEKCDECKLGYFPYPYCLSK